MEAKYWKKFETNKKSMAVYVLFVENKEEEMKQMYILKHHFECERKVILLMITYGKKWHYLAV